MAGLAFPLQRGVRTSSYAALLWRYAVAGAVGSGPWVVSIVSMALIGVVRSSHEGGGVASIFLGTVTHLMAYSMILAGGVQLLVARYCADRTYENDGEAVSPAVFGALLLMTAASAAIGTTLLVQPMSAPAGFRLLAVCSFVVLSNLWIASAILSAQRQYTALLFTYVGGYALTVAAAIALKRFGLSGLMAGFCLGQGAMLFAVLILLVRRVPPAARVSFRFLDRSKSFFDLGAIGLLFNVAVWADKFVFWWSPVTSTRLLGPIRASVVYDVPVSLAYLSIIPAMAVFFVRLEGEFAPEYERYFRDVREGRTLDAIERQRDALVAAARRSVHAVFRTQALVVAAVLVKASAVLALFHVPRLYLYLFRVDVVGVGGQVVLLAILTLLFYLDHRRGALLLVATFAAVNVSLSMLSVRLGVRFYGYGFAVATCVTSVIGLAIVSKRLDRLEFATFVRR